MYATTPPPPHMLRYHNTTGLIAFPGHYGPTSQLRQSLPSGPQKHAYIRYSISNELIFIATYLVGGQLLISLEYNIHNI